MQQVTRTFSVTSPEHCLSARCKSYFLLKSIILVSCKELKEKIPQCFHLLTSVQKCPGAFGNYRRENNDSCFTGACRALSGVEEKLSQWAEGEE